MLPATTEHWGRLLRSQWQEPLANIFVLSSAEDLEEKLRLAVGEKIVKSSIDFNSGKPLEVYARKESRGAERFIAYHCERCEGIVLGMPNIEYGELAASDVASACYTCIACETFLGEILHPMKSE